MITLFTPGLQVYLICFNLSMTAARQNNNNSTYSGLAWNSNDGCPFVCLFPFELASKVSSSGLEKELSRRVCFISQIVSHVLEPNQVRIFLRSCPPVAFPLCLPNWSSWQRQKELSLWTLFSVGCWFLYHEYQLIYKPLPPTFITFSFIFFFLARYS